MRKLCFIIFISSLFIDNVYNQFTCEIITDSVITRTSGVIVDYMDYIPDSNTPMKNIRLNFHFMLLEDTHPDSPGNFTSYDDGRGNTDFTAYDFVDDLLYWTNFRLGGNTQMTYPLGNSTLVLSRKYRFDLNGVFFHEDNTMFWFNTYPEYTYSENMGEAINIYFQSDGTINSGGHANMSGNRFIDFKAKWDFYNYCLETGLDWENFGNWVNAGGIMHETGHSLSLLHTILTNGGDCCNYCDDYCTDTPTINYVLTHDGVDPCQTPFWNNPLHSNNIMEYSGYDAITPEQLGRTHWTIENELEEYQSCYYSTLALDITSFTDNKSYIAKSVAIPSGSNIMINNHKALYINAEYFSVNGALSVELGSQLIVNPIPNCN